MTRDATVVEVGGGPRPLVTKRATTPGAIGRLRAEAAVLAVARHPGVIALVGVEEVNDAGGMVAELQMRTTFAGSRTLASLGQVPLVRAAGLVSALAATVADLHNMGVVHGRITADHVVLAADGRPVLCGFANAGRADTGGDGRAGPAGDVSALGVLLRDLVLQTDAVLEEAPSGVRGWRRGGARQARGPLLNLADQATADEPGHRPSAEQFAAAIRTTVPEATLREVSIQAPSSDAVGTRNESDPASRPSRRILMGATLAAFGVAALAAMTWDRSGASPEAHVAPDTSIVTPVPPTTVPSSAVPSTAVPPNTATSNTATSNATTGSPIDAAEGCATGEGAGTTSTGAPCPVSFHFEHGAITIGGTRYDVGLESGAAAVGDFDCDGQLVAAVVDLATGDVYLFDGWATESESRSAAAVERIGSPRQIIAEAHPDGCHRVVVLDEWGLRHVIDRTPKDTP